MEASEPVQTSDPQDRIRVRTSLLSTRLMSSSSAVVGMLLATLSLVVAQEPPGPQHLPKLFPDVSKIPGLNKIPTILLACPALATCPILVACPGLLSCKCDVPKIPGLPKLPCLPNFPGAPDIPLIPKCGSGKNSTGGSGGQPKSGKPSGRGLFPTRLTTFYRYSDIYSGPDQDRTELTAFRT